MQGSSLTYGNTQGYLKFKTILGKKKKKTDSKRVVSLQRLLPHIQTQGGTFPASWFSQTQEGARGQRDKMNCCHFLSLIMVLCLMQCSSNQRGSIKVNDTVLPD